MDIFGARDFIITALQTLLADVVNEKEIQSLITLAKAGLVDIVAVGNEVLHRGEISEKELIIYIERIYIRNKLLNNNNTSSP